MILSFVEPNDRWKKIYIENEALTMIKRSKKWHFAYPPSLIMAIYSGVLFLRNLSLCWMYASK